MKLTANERSSLPDDAFALPGRRYPIHDTGHAQAALSDVAQHGTPEEQSAVKKAVAKRYPGMQIMEPPAAMKKLKKRFS